MSADDNNDGDKNNGGGEEGKAGSAPPPETTDTTPPDGTEGPAGRRWLKYAGVGGGRQAVGGGERLHGEGITSLGSLEAEILGILWEIGEPATGMAVMERSLYQRRGRGEEPASFATINTTLRRLTQKGLLTSAKNAQRTPVYSPTVEREAMAARVLNNVSQTLLGQPLHALLPRLVGTLRDPSGSARPRRPGSTVPGAGAEGDETADPGVQQLLQALERLARREEGEPSEGSPPHKA